MNVELNAFVVIDDWQAVVNRTVANYFDSLGFEHLDQVLEMRVFDLLNMNLLDAVRVEEIIVCLYRSLNPNITVDEAMYCGAMNQCFDYTGWRKIHRQRFNTFMMLSERSFSSRENMTGVNTVTQIIRTMRRNEQQEVKESE